MPCIVLDPFGGSGTTGAVAAELQRHSLSIDINEEYCALEVKRIEEAAAQRPLFDAAGDAPTVRPVTDDTQLLLDAGDPAVLD